MLKVALTGGIATGKTHVLAKLRERGVPTIDADDLVHDAFAPNTSTTRAVVLEFGHAILNPDGSVDRPVLASKVFTDAKARLRLEAIVHPMVYEEIREWLDGVDRPIAVASIPLLYETQHQSDFDAVIVTACDAGLQLRRIMDRGFSEEEALRWMGAQIPTDEKVRRADYVIWTNGTMLETDAQVDELLMKLGRVVS